MWAGLRRAPGHAARVRPGVAAPPGGRLRDARPVDAGEPGDLRATDGRAVSDSQADRGRRGAGAVTEDTERLIAEYEERTNGNSHWTSSSSARWKAEVVKLLAALRSPHVPTLDAETEMALRVYLWLGHGHSGQYGDDGEMQCGACASVGNRPCVIDYKRAPLADVIRQAITSREAVNLAALRAAGSAQVWQPIETFHSNDEADFWIVPKTPEESYGDTSGNSIFIPKHRGRLHRGKYRTWS